MNQLYEVNTKIHGHILYICLVYTYKSFYIVRDERHFMPVFYICHNVRQLSIFM